MTSTAQGQEARLLGLPPFDALSPDGRERLLEAASVGRFDVGRELSSAGSIGDRVLVLLEGTARLLGERDGRPFTLERLEPGAIVGLASLLRAAGGGAGERRHRGPGRQHSRCGDSRTAAPGQATPRLVRPPDLDRGTASAAAGPRRGPAGQRPLRAGPLARADRSAPPALPRPDPGGDRHHAICRERRSCWPVPTFPTGRSVRCSRRPRPCPGPGRRCPCG